MAATGLAMGLSSTSKAEEEPAAPPPFHLTDRDKWLLSLTDDEFTPHTWDGLKHIIASNELEDLLRKPSDLRRYLAWTSSIKAEYGSVTNYLIKHRLPWGTPPFSYNSSIPFLDPEDFKILLNDWPYGLTDGITHIVVWSKTPIPTNEETGDVTEESRSIIEDFVRMTFVERLGGNAERVLWFKNWVQLQSVRSLEHIHIMVKDASKEDLEYWTS